MHPRSSQRAHLAAVAGLLAALCAACRTEPRLARVEAPLGGREACAPCHAAIVTSWERSLHRQSFSDTWFQSGYRVDHRSFCRDCHAPLAAGSDPVPGSVAHEDGITCTSCHVRARSHPSPRPSADFGTRACVDCHEFRFPDEGTVRFDPNEHMQRTGLEHAASGATSTCVDCHMRGDGSHAFTVLAEPERIAAAIEIQAAFTYAAESTEVVVELSARNAGHAVPTGDVFRALELSVVADEATERRLLMRRFGTRLALDPRGVTARLGEIEDTRIPPRGRRTERFVFPGRVGTVRYRLDYLRVNPAQAAAQALEDAENRLRLHEGVLTRSAP